MWARIAAIVLPSVLVAGQGGQAAQGPPVSEIPTAEVIEKAIDDLGDDSFTVRERASEVLWQAGRAAEPALIDAAKSRDAEVVARARRILRSFQYGIYPDTPEETVRLISQFRHGNQTVKLAVLRKLMELGRTSTLLALVEMEPAQGAREQLVRGLLKNFEKIIGGMLVHDARTSASRKRAEQLLRMGAVNDAGMRNYAAYLLLRGRIEPTIIETRQRMATAPGTANARLLVHLLRAKGDLGGARRAAEDAGDASLTESILFESGAWKELAEIHDEAGRDAGGNLAGGIVHLGYTAAFHRLAGNSSEFRQAVAGIKRLADVKPNKIRYCAEALMVNDCFAEAVAMYRRLGGTAEFRILARQRRFRDALAAAGVGDPRGPLVPWFNGSQADPPQQSGETRARFEMGVAVAATLHRLAEKQQAAKLFAELARAAIKNNGLSMRPVCEAEYELGLTDEAFEHAAMVLDTEWRLTLLRTLFPDHDAAAELWWGLLCRRRPDEPRKITLGTLRQVLGPGSAGTPASVDWLGLVKEAEKQSADLGPMERGKWLAALGETCLVRGRPRLAEGYFQKAAEVAPAVGSLTQLGNLAAGDDRWEKAAQWYGKAWEADRSKPIALFLQGRALLQAGQESDGRRLIEAAWLLPLGGAETRHALANELHARGLTDEAVRQWELALCTGELRSWAVAEAAKRLGQFTAGKDDFKAAAYWQRPLLRCLRTSSTIVTVEGYLEIAHQLHKARARGLLAAGKVDEAIREMRLSHAALPGETPLAIDLVPRLEKAGRRAEADELFEAVFAVNARVCEDFPNAAGYHDTLASLAGQCNRRLQEALQHAVQAVNLAPENAAYLGTLAEVHFRRGDRPKAIELARRCIALDPQQERFQRQLERFEAP